MLTITENTRVAVVDDTNTVRGSDAGEILTYEDGALSDALRGFGSGTFTLWQLPEWEGMTDADIYRLPRSIEALRECGAILQRTVKAP